MAEIKFEITDKLGVIGEGSKGWKKELNLISWNDRKAKADIRDWDEKHEKMGVFVKRKVYQFSIEKYTIILKKINGFLAIPQFL